jgi:hypothetical protein
VSTWEIKEWTRLKNVPEIQMAGLGALHPPIHDIYWHRQNVFLQAPVKPQSLVWTDRHANATPHAAEHIDLRQTI